VDLTSENQLFDFWRDIEICLVDPQGNRELLTTGKSSLSESSPRVMPDRIENFVTSCESELIEGKIIRQRKGDHTIGRSQLK
jgi:hypothetical protein